MHECMDAHALTLPPLPLAQFPSSQTCPRFCLSEEKVGKFLMSLSNAKIIRGVNHSLSVMGAPLWIWSSGWMNNSTKRTTVKYSRSLYVSWIGHLMN